MSIALRLPNQMTVSEFWDWTPPPGFEDRRWQLIYGEPVCMAPPSNVHSLIQGRLFRLLDEHLDGSTCQVLFTPGITLSHVQTKNNFRIPDLGVTCKPVPEGNEVDDPCVLIEILSPSNKAETYANVLLYTRILSVMEVLVLSSTSMSGELLRRRPDGLWPTEPTPLDADSQLQLAPIDFDVPLRACYARVNLR